MLGEQVRWRREQKRELTASRRQLYGKYLSAAAYALDGMRVASQADHTSTAAMAAAVREAFKASELYALRFQLTILSPKPVVDPAVEVLRQARTFRDLLAEGEELNSDAVRAANDACFARIRDTADAMRYDLGVAPLDWTSQLDHATARKIDS